MNKNTKDRSSADNGDKDLIIFFLGLSIVGAIIAGITKILLIPFDPSSFWYAFVMVGSVVFLIRVFLMIWSRFMEQDNR